MPIKSYTRFTLLETHIYTLFSPLQSTYNLYVIHPFATCTYMNFVLLQTMYCIKHSLHTCDLLRFSLQGQIHYLAEFPFAKITNCPRTSADSLMLYPSCLHSLYMMCDVTMTSLLYIQYLGVNIESPPQVNIKLGFPCGCEAPKQDHKYHHQTHESPIQIYDGFHQIKSVMWCQ
jgi:hypothetical protein